MTDVACHAEPEELRDIVGAIYDTVLDRSAWPGVLLRLSRFVGAAASALFWHDPASGRGDVYFHDGAMDPDYHGLYFSTYWRLNPTIAPRPFAGLDESVSTTDLMPYDDFLRTRFYREWAAPQGLVDLVSVPLEKSASKPAMFGVFRHARDGLVDEATRQRMRLLAPHLRRAVLLSRAVDVKQSEAAFLAETLDGLRVAGVVVDAEGRIMHTNAAGQALLTQGEPIRAVNGLLGAGASDTDGRLRYLLRATVEGDQPMSREAVASPPVGPAGDRYVARALPLAATGRGRTGQARSAASAIFIRKASVDAPTAAAAVAEAYGLTLAEARVLSAIVDVGGAPEVAGAGLGTAVTTVRTHLRRVL